MKSYNNTYNSNQAFPFWLDSHAEAITQKKEKDFAEGLFVQCFKTLDSIGGFSFAQILSLITFFFIKTKGFHACNHNNLFHWEITQNFVRNYKTTHGGKCPKWYFWGNKYYRVFSSLNEFFNEWMTVFLPKGNHASSSQYSIAGFDFWNGKEDWYFNFINSNEDMCKSRSMFESNLNKTKILFAKHVLGSKNFPNPFWSTKEEQLCTEFQTSRNISMTGNLNDETLKLLFEKWKHKGMK